MFRGIKTIAIIFCHTHIFAYLPNTDIYIGVETVRIAVSTMKVKQVFFIFISRKILVKGGLDKRLNSHFHISLVSATVPNLCSLIANDTIAVICLFKLIQVNGIHST